MFLNVTNRTSSAIDSLQVDALNKQAIVTFINGNTYVYDNVSTRAIVNLIFNPDVSLGFWVNNNLVKSSRAKVLSGTESNYPSVTAKRARLDAILDNKDYPNKEVGINLPSFV